MVTRRNQQDSLLQERRETLCSLKADHGQVGPVKLCELEGASAVDGYTPSLGGKETLGPLVVARIPSVIVPVCVVKGVSAASVLKRAHRVSVMASVSKMACVGERPCMEEALCVRVTACVRSRYEREMAVGMRENATACPSVMEWCVSVVTRRSAWVEWRRRRHRTRDKGRVAAVAVLGTAPGLHGSEREVRAVLCTSPPRAQLRE